MKYNNDLIITNLRSHPILAEGLPLPSLQPPLPNRPSYCACGEMFIVNHALSCKKGGLCSSETRYNPRSSDITHQ